LVIKTGEGREERGRVFDTNRYFGSHVKVIKVKYLHHLSSGIRLCEAERGGNISFYILDL